MCCDFGSAGKVAEDTKRIELAASTAISAVGPTTLSAVPHVRRFRSTSGSSFTQATLPTRRAGTATVSQFVHPGELRGHRHNERATAPTPPIELVKEDGGSP